MKIIKNTILLSALILPLGLYGQQDFKIEGKIVKSAKNQKAYLTYRTSNGTTIVDSVLLKKGKFTFKGIVDSPTKATVSSGLTMRSVSRTNFKTIYIGENPIKIKSVKNMENALIKGGKLNDENQKLESALGPIQAKMQALNAKFREIKQDDPNREELAIALRKESAILSEAIKNEQEKFIKENPDSQISLELANTLISYPADAKSMETHYNGLSARVKGTKAGQAFAENISKVKAIDIGQIAPDFTQNDPNENPVSLSDFRGKYVLIDFWASWCGPCRQENPNLVKAFHTYKDRNFTVLGVSLDNPGKKDAWLKAIADDELDWAQVSDLAGWNNAVAKQYYIRSIPQNLLIDPNGKIIAKNLRGKDLAPALEKLLK